MRKKAFISLLFAAALLCGCKESMSHLTDRVFDVARQHAFNMDARLGPSTHPRSLKSDGSPWNTDVEWWCSGFFPGVVWYIYEYTGDDAVLELAKRSTSKLDSLIYNPRTHHDIGFQINCSYGNGYRLTGEPSYRDMQEKAAAKLARRFSSVVGCTRSWNWNDRPDDFPVIIDNMMNLELLMWSGREFRVDSLTAIARTHANTTIRNHFRPDYTTYHGVVYDPHTGAIKKRRTFQGYSDDSAWSRGQGWALYGYTMMYDQTCKDGEPHDDYLLQAENIAKMLIERLPEDGIPYWDFDAPEISEALRDASAGSLMASAFILLSTHTKDKTLSKACLDMAEKQIRTLASEEYLAEPGTNGDFLLKHSVGDMPKKREVDVPLIYADYYFIEALLRYKAL